MTRLIIARHGNTFNAGDTPTRVGARTDLPLVDKGHQQARALGRDLKARGFIPDVAYSSTLQRTKETASLALEEMGLKLPVYTLDIFNEIDYGPDENKPEDDVIARIGRQAIKDWNQNAKIPDGWDVDPSEVIHNWQRFAQSLTKMNDTVSDEILQIQETTLVVTSNGIARFAPYITNSFEKFTQSHSIKLKTGSYGTLLFSNGKWKIEDWNIVPLLN